MIRTTVALALVAATATWSGAEAEERTVTLHVENMTCALCQITVGQAIEQVSGVTEVTISVADKTAIVDYDDSATTVAAIAEAPTNAGYPAWPIGQ
jgi:mercuric ion binding protein